MTTQYEMELDDEVNIEADEAASSPVFVARCVAIEFVRRNGRRQMHVAWEPLSFKQVWNQETRPWKDDYTHDYLTSHTNDGRLMGGTTQFGRVSAAFKSFGTPLTTNAGLKDTIAGRVYRVQNAREEYVRSNDREETARAMFSAGYRDLTKEQQAEVNIAAPKAATFFVLPLEELDDYIAPDDVRTVKRGFKDAPSSMPAASVSPEQIAALKATLNGVATDEFANALIDSGNQIIVCDPFMQEAMNGSLVERLVGLGGKVVGDKIFFV